MECWGTIYGNPKLLGAMLAMLADPIWWEKYLLELHHSS